MAKFWSVFISLVNVLLSVITLEIYAPWVMVLSWRWLYKNMELNGARFGYHAKGGALFLSWLLISIFVFIFIRVAILLHLLLASRVIFLLILIMPFLW